MMAKTTTFKVENLPFMVSCNYMNDTNCVSKEHKEAFAIASDSARSLSENMLPEEYIITGETEKCEFNWSDSYYTFATADGMIYGVIPDDDWTSFSVVVDVNGKKNPNTVKKDLYKFRYNNAGRLADVSDELEYVVRCSRENPYNCTICPGLTYCYRFVDGECIDICPH